jgi:hypothetical protein
MLAQKRNHRKQRVAPLVFHGVGKLAFADYHLELSPVSAAKTP